MDSTHSICSRQRPTRAVHVWVFAMLAVSGSPSVASERVQFPSFNKQLTKPLEAELAKPPGAGPFPAVVLLHGCGGMGHARDKNWVSRLTEWGYITLRVDSLSARGQTSICDDVFRVSRFPRARDTHGALAYLAARSDVAKDRIAVMGWSHGAWAVLTAVDNDPATDVWASRFRAAVAFYPPCLDAMTGLATPILTLVGEADTWTPAQQCRQMQFKGGDKGLFELKTYPEAVHAFDHDAPERVNMGHRIGYNAAAAADAIPLVRAFLDRHLKQ